MIGAKEREKKLSAERICKVIMAENFPIEGGKIKTYRSKKLSKSSNDKPKETYINTHHN